METHLKISHYVRNGKLIVCVLVDKLLLVLNGIVLFEFV